MATQIFNQAGVTYNFGSQSGSAISNLATALLEGPLNVSKSTLRSTYEIGDDITYILTTTNTTSIPINNVTISDNLGEFIPDGFMFPLFPLTFGGVANLYINGIYVSPIIPTSIAPRLTFNLPTIPAESTVTILYFATVNETAPFIAGSTITNTSTWTVRLKCHECDPLTSSATITAESTADLRIIKSICPEVVSCYEPITTTFFLYNYGNTPATNVILSDTFTPAPETLSITIDGVALSPNDHSYLGGVLRIPSVSSTFSLTVPSALHSRDQNGLNIITPGLVTIAATGSFTNCC